MSSVTLNTGAKMPIVGLGTWKSTSGECERAKRAAGDAAGDAYLDARSVKKRSIYAPLMRHAAARVGSGAHGMVTSATAMGFRYAHAFDCCLPPSFGRPPLTQRR